MVCCRVSSAPGRADVKNPLAVRLAAFAQAVCRGCIGQCELLADDDAQPSVVDAFAPTGASSSCICSALP